MQAYSTALIELTGRPPGLLVHSSELADETNKYAIEIRELVDAGRGKKRLTDEQRERKDHAQWRGALGTLYTRPDDADPSRDLIVMPANNLFQAVIVAARQFNLGTAIQDRGAVTFGEAEFEIHHDGPDNLKALYDNPHYRLRIPVNPNPSARTKSLIPTMRPLFPVWKSRLTALVFPEAINWDQFVQIIEVAGNVGVGNGRKIGYGRFDVQIRQAKSGENIERWLAFKS